MKVIIGTIVGVFGVHGEVKVKSATDFAKLRYKKGNEVTLYSPFTHQEEKKIINSYKQSRGLDIISFQGMENPEGVQKYISYQILMEQLESLDENTYFYADLWKCEVFFHNQLIGVVSEMFDSGAGVILRIKREGNKDLLYPFLDKFIEKVDVENKKIFIKPLEGML